MVTKFYLIYFICAANLPSFFSCLTVVRCMHCILVTYMLCLVNYHHHVQFLSGVISICGGGRNNTILKYPNSPPPFNRLVRLKASSSFKSAFFKLRCCKITTASYGVGRYGISQNCRTLHLDVLLSTMIIPRSGGCLTRRPPQVTSQSPVVFTCILFLILSFKICLTRIIYDYDE